MKPRTIDLFEDTKRRTVLRLTRTRGAPTDRVSTATAEELNMPENWVDILHITELRGEISNWRRVEEDGAAARYVCYIVSGKWRERIGASLVVTR